LVAGACLADVGHQVICMDINAERIARLEAGEIPIYEPGLTELVTHNVTTGRLRFTTDTANAVKESELLFFIAAGTPRIKMAGIYAIFSPSPHQLFF
jgi:UDPglucose 6-dehydrogenase